MKTNNPKVQYDSQAKILSIRFSPKKSVDSDVNGNVVVDYDRNGNIVNLDIMKLSLSEFIRNRSVRRLIHTDK